jgi:hypothetical protein
LIALSFHYFCCTINLTIFYHNLLIILHLQPPAHSFWTISQKISTVTGFFLATSLLTSFSRLQYDFPNGRFPKNFGRNYHNSGQDFGKTSIWEIGFREIVGKGFLYTSLFKISYKFSMGLRSGLFDGQSSDLGHRSERSFLAFLVYVRVLSCWNIQCLSIMVLALLKRFLTSTIHNASKKKHSNLTFDWKAPQPWTLYGENRKREIDFYEKAKDKAWKITLKPLNGSLKSQDVWP